MADRTDPQQCHVGNAFLLLGLAPGGVYLARQVTLSAGALLPHHFTLTMVPIARYRGGLLSVALSLVSRPGGVTDHPVLWSPDFPPAHGVTLGRRPSDPLPRRAVWYNEIWYR